MLNLNNLHDVSFSSFISLYADCPSSSYPSIKFGAILVLGHGMSSSHQSLLP